MVDQDQTAEPGTGGSLDEAVRQHAGILVGETDSQDEGETKAEGETPDAAVDEVEEPDAVDEPDEGDDEAEGESDDDTDESDDDAEGDDEDEGEDSEGDEPKFTVKVAGEELEVSQSELIAGYARQADYTRKTQALAKEREEFKSEAESVRQEREQYATLLDKLAEQVDSGGEQEPDWDRLYQEDPNEWVRQRELHRSRRERQQAIEAERERVRQQQESERQAQLRDKIVEEQNKLTEAIPDWADDEKAQAEKKRVAKYARETAGFSDDEVAQIYDHRAVAVLRKAMLYDELASQRGKVKPAKGEGSPKPARPGTSKSGSSTKSRATKKARQRLAQSGSLDDAAALIVDSLE